MPRGVSAPCPRCRPPFDAGERAPRRVLAQLRVHQLAVAPVLDPTWLADLDEPADVAAGSGAALPPTGPDDRARPHDHCLKST